jgi:hypothetical protein
MSYFKEQYKTELERKDRLNTTITIYYTISIVLVGALAKLFDAMPNFWEQPTLYVIAVIFFLLTLLGTIYFQVKSFFKKYRYVITPYEAVQQSQILLNYYQETNTPNINFEQEIESALAWRYGEYAEENITTNDKKERELDISKKFLSLSILFAFLSYGILYLSRMH